MCFSHRFRSLKVQNSATMVSCVYGSVVLLVIFTASFTSTDSDAEYENSTSMNVSVNFQTPGPPIPAKIYNNKECIELIEKSGARAADLILKLRVMK